MNNTNQQSQQQQRNEQQQAAADQQQFNLQAAAAGAMNGQFNPGNFQTGIPNIDLNSLGAMGGSLGGINVPGLQGNVLADIPGLENLNGNAQLSSLLNLGDLSNKAQQLQNDPTNPLLQNLTQNPEKLAAQLAAIDSKHDAASLSNLLGIAGDKLGVGPDAAKGQTSLNLSQGQNLQINSGTTATSPGEKEQVAVGSQGLDKSFDVSKILQDIPGLSTSYNDAGNQNQQLQDVLKALNGGVVGNNADQFQKNAVLAGATGGDQGANGIKSDLNSVAQLGDIEQLQGLLGVGGAGGNPADKLSQLPNFDLASQIKLEAPSKDATAGQFGQLGNLDYPQLQAHLQSLTNLTTATQEQNNFGGLNQQNLGHWNAASGLQTNNLLQQLNGINNPLTAGNSSAIAGLGNINGLGLGLNMQLNQFGQTPTLPTGMNPIMRQNQGNVLIPGSQAHVYNFNLKGPDHEIKLFVGGLAFQTQECDLIDYFKQFGIVVDAIVMRDRQSQRGRGFGFVKMRFDNKDVAQENKNKLLSINCRNPNDGHKINNKVVDVKSADDYVKPQQGQQPPQPPPSMNPQLMAMTKDQKMPESVHQMPRAPPEHMKPHQNIKPQMRDEPNQMSNVTKPNPYVIVKQKESGITGTSSKDGDQKEDEAKEIVFEYPKSKIFVGGLDFKLNNDDLRQHFQQFGPIESAVILKDINTQQSRGFGFVTFKDEAVAQNLIQNVQHTNILGRKVDIKTAEPKQQGMNQPPPIIPRKYHNGGMYGQGGGPNGGPGNDRQQNQFAMIPQYGDAYGNKGGEGQPNRRGGAPGELVDSPQDGYNDSQSSNNYPSRRGGDPSQYRRGGDNQGRNDGGGYGPPGGHSHPNGPHYDYRGERERGRDGFMDRRDHRHRDDRDRHRGDRDRRGDEFDVDRRDRRGERDRGGRRRGRYQHSRSDSIDSSRSSSSYNHQARGNRGGDERRGRQHRPRRGPHHGGPGRASPGGPGEQETAQ